MISFSNPDPNLAASAALLQARAPEANAPNISGLISAMLEDNYRKQQMQQQLLDRVNKSIGDIRQSHDAGQLADYIQGQSPFVNADMASQLSGMSPQSRLAALKYSQNQNDAEDQNTRQANLDDIKAQLDAAKSNYYNRVPTRGGLTPNAQGVQDRFNEKQALGDLTRNIADLNIGGGYPAKSGPITQATLGSQSDVHSGTGPQGEYIPEGYYGIGGQTLKTVVPADQFDAAHTALDNYKKMLTSRGQPREQSQAQGQYPVGTRASQGGVTYEYDGTSWNPVQ